MPAAPDPASARAASVLSSALLESAWITSRICAGVGLATWIVGALVAPRARASRAGGPAARWAPLVHAAVLVAGGAAVALTRGEAERVLPGAAQVLVAALAALAGAGGGALGAWSARTLGRSAAGGGLVTTGPYGIVRHPFYLSLAAVTLAFGLALGSLTGTLAFAAALLAMSAWRARDEERALARAHPEAWPAYAARVRAFTPRI